MMRRSLSAALMVAAVALCGAPPAVFAQSSDGGAASPATTSMEAEITVLYATNDGSGIDPKIGKMPELNNPPFSSYKSYKLLDRSTAQLVKGKAATTKLPNARDLKITMKDEIPPKDGEAKRYVI